MLVSTRCGAVACPYSEASVCRAVNQALLRHPQARQRTLQLHAPIILAVWPQARLVQEEASMCTLGEVQSCSFWR